jgi:hypothetical protein
VAGAHGGRERGVFIQIKAAHEVGAVFVIGQVGFGAGGVAGGIEFQEVTVAAHVAFEAARHADDEAVVWYV